MLSNFNCNVGADITCLKRHGGWASSNVAESYIQESFEEKAKIARKVFGASTSSPKCTLDVTAEVKEVTNKSNREQYDSSSSSGDHKFQFNNCTFNF